MKHYLIAFLFVFGTIILSCDDTDGSFVDNAVSIDSLGQQIDTAAYPIDSAEVYFPEDTLWIPGDSIYFPVDSVAPGDTIVLRRNLILHR